LEQYKQYKKFEKSKVNCKHKIFQLALILVFPLFLFALRQVLNEIEEANKRRPNNLSRGTSRGNSQLNKTRDTSGESSPESDGEDELADRGRQDQSDLPSEYWQIQKLVKYLKVCLLNISKQNPTSSEKSEFQDELNLVEMPEL
jgi:hypothetical protein